MVYCSKCGSPNEDDAENCAQCKAPLHISRPKRRRERHIEDECFGLPHGGTIAGLIFGIIIILWGLTLIPGLLPEGFAFWPVIVIIFGVLIIGGAFYTLSRR